MPHLINRFCLVPFCDLTESPEGGHHAIGSPHFGPLGRPNFPDPIVVAVRSDIVDEALPTCSAIGVSCNTRPYHSYGPVIRKVFEKSQPHNYPGVRQGMEGVMEVGEVRAIPPGGLGEQTSHIFLGCVATMTAGTNDAILNQVLQNFSLEFGKLPPGSILRMPIIGTGKARREDTTEKIFRDVVSLTIAHFFSALLPEDEKINPRKLLLVHPLEYESGLIATALAEKGLFLTLLDKMGILTTDSRIVYGIGHSEGDPKRCFVDKDNFLKAISFFDSALDKLLKGDRKDAIKDAAAGSEVEPALGGMYLYVHALATRKTGLTQAITEGALALAREGRIRDALCVARTLDSLGGGKKEKAFIACLKESYLDYCVAAVEGRLLYENYMLAEQALQSIYQGGSVSKSCHGSKSVDTHRIPQLIQGSLEALEKIQEKIPSRVVENTYHIVIRKFMADQVETVGARCALDNLLEFKKHNRLNLSPEDEKICQELYKLANFIEQNQDKMSQAALQKNVLEALLAVLPRHGTLRLEAARFYLKGDRGKVGIRASVLTRGDISNAWEHLQVGQKENLRDHGILSYLGFIIVLQGGKFLSAAEDFYMLFARLIEEELSHGKYGIRPIKSPEGEIIEIGRDPYAEQAYRYYQKYHEMASVSARLAKSLSAGEGTAGINLYREMIHLLSEVGRYDLIHLYEETLGESWVALLSRSQVSLGSIPLPFGEISLDLIVNLYKKIRRWWKYRNLKEAKIHKSIGELLERMGKKISR